MADSEKQIVAVGPRLSKFIGAKATREKKLQAASMQAEFTLRDTLIILCYLAKDSDPEISAQARKNLIPAVRGWYSRPDKPELPEPIYQIVMQVIARIGTGEKDKNAEDDEIVTGNIGLLGLGEIIQAIDHNNRTVRITLIHEGVQATIFTLNGKVIGAVCEKDDGIDALYRAFSWIDAPFRYEHGEPGDFNNKIKMNTLNLVMDALDHAPEEDPYESEISKSWKVQGNLKIMNVFEIAEIFEMNSKQSVCRLIRDNMTGELYFKNGRVVNAQLQEMTGMDAACHLLAWPSAQFSIFRGGENVAEIIHVGMQNLIIEAMRLLDEGIIGDEKIASELAVINELFEGRDVGTLPILEKIRIVFGDDQDARDILETDPNPLVRKAIKVKISKTVHKYLNPTTDHSIRIKAAKGLVPLSTTEKLVLLSYFSHDESSEIRETAKETLANLDIPTFKKGFGADLHPSVMDFLVRETIKDESLIRAAVTNETLLEETALFILENWKSDDLYLAFLENKKFLERSPLAVAKLAEILPPDSNILQRLVNFETGLLEGQGEIKLEGPLSFFGLAGLTRAIRQGMRSGTIVLETLANAGRLYFNKGKIIGVTWDNLQGKDALEAVVNATGVKFRYTLRTYNQQNNIDTLIAEEFIDKSPLAVPRQEEHPMGMRLASGHLNAMDLFEVLTALEGTVNPMLISVICEEGTGEIYRDKSRILHVNVEGKEGPMDSMAALLSWTGLRIIIRQAHGEFTTSLDKNLTDFFTDAIKLIPDELSRLTKPGELPEWELSEQEFESLYHQILNMGVAEKLKLALMGNKEARNILIRDPNKLVAVAVVKSPKIQEQEIEAITRSRQVSEDVLRTIASSKDWMKTYNIKVNLAGNSKTPLPIAMRLLPQLYESDLRKLARSKNISSTLATQARRLMEMKRSAG
jgi:hypothetical protein